MSKANIIGVVGAAVVLFAIGGLYVLLNRGDQPRAATDPTRESSEPSAEQGEGQPVPSARIQPSEPATGSTKTDDSVGAEEPSEKVREVISSNGTRIRDYRTGDAPMRDPEAPLRKPLSVTKIEPTLASRMGAHLRRAANQCRSEHSAEVGSKAKVQPRATFEVKDGRLLVTDVEISLTNIPAGGEFESCFESAALGISVEATGHPDIKEHKLMVPIDFPG